MSSPADSPEPRKLYGRRRSHKLRKGREALMESLAPALAIPEVGVPGAAIDLAALFPKAEAVWLEIGFGGGEHLAHLARTHPEIGFIGCEHYLDGVAKLVSTVARERLGNVRLHPHDARDLIDALPSGAIGRVFLLYPDPWPKKRHHKRRFVSRENMDALARILRPGGELRIASDIDDYCRQALAVGLDHTGFDWTAEGSADWTRPWPDWPSTRYEQKALREGRRPTYLTFQRR